MRYWRISTHVYASDVSGMWPILCEAKYRYFSNQYNSRVAIYDRRIFVRLAAGGVAYDKCVLKLKIQMYLDSTK